MYFIKTIAEIVKPFNNNFVQDIKNFFWTLKKKSQILLIHQSMKYFLLLHV